MLDAMPAHGKAISCEEAWGGADEAEPFTMYLFPL